MTVTPGFDITVEGTVSDRLLVAFASPGMAGLIAGDHLVSDLGAEQVGHASARDLPAIVPFTDGTPRHAVRLYDTDGPAILVSEVFTPVGVGERLAEAVGGLVDEAGVREVTGLYGVPYPHGPDDHAVFGVHTDGFDDTRLGEHGVELLSGGFLDGFPAALVSRGMVADGHDVGLLVTPAHPPGPDFEGALLLLEAAATHYGLDVDTTTVEERSEEIRRYYRELADRMESVETDTPEDRMYM